MEVENEGRRSDQSDGKSDNSQSLEALKPEVLSDTEKIKQSQIKIKLFELLIHLMEEAGAKEDTKV